MLSAKSSDALVVWAPAKVNLFLEVLARRPDGYHEINTLMVTVSLYDTLEFKEEASGAIRLRCDQPNLSTGADNLVVRAAELLRRRSGCARGADIGLAKRIPLAAGLAGGSTDAAAALVGLNRLWGLGLAEAELAGLAAELGSDIPFFFAAPAAWCTGRREGGAAEAGTAAVVAPGLSWCRPFHRGGLPRRKGPPGAVPRRRDPGGGGGG